MRHRSVEERQREVEEWRASGLSAARYAGRHGYSTASLLRWAKSYASGEGATTTPAFVRWELAFAPASSPLVVEAGHGRVVVPRGFDAAHLRAVVAALAGVDA
jgi:transposase-like protein